MLRRFKCIGFEGLSNNVLVTWEVIFPCLCLKNEGKDEDNLKGIWYVWWKSFCCQGEIDGVSAGVSHVKA